MSVLGRGRPERGAADPPAVVAPPPGHPGFPPFDARRSIASRGFAVAGRYERPLSGVLIRLCERPR